MNNEDNDSKIGFYAFCGFNIFFVIAFILIVFLLCCDNASASQVVYYNTSKVVNNTTYYGYNLPTRPTNFDGSSSASVNINLSLYNSSHWYNSYTSTELLYLQSLDNRIIDEVNLVNESLNRNFKPTNIWTMPLQLGSKVNTTQIQNTYAFSFGFRPSAFIDSNIDTMFEDGFVIYEEDSSSYNNNYAYSYDFDIILYNFDSNLSNSFGNFNVCQYVMGNPEDYMNCVNNSTITFDTIVSTNNIIYRTYHINFGANTWKFGFNKYTLANNNSQYGVEGNNLIVNSSYYNIYTSDYLMVSQPYNIVFWSTDNSYTCSTSCWTQQDSDSNQRIPSYNDYLFENMINIADNLNYYGFGGVINYTYDFIKSLLEDTNDTCVSLSVPILGKTITLPSSCTFWNRQDVATYESFYYMFILGIFSFFIAWKIYNDILNIYMPDTRVDEEVSKL